MTGYVPFRQWEQTQHRDVPPANPANLANPAPEEKGQISRISKISKPGGQDSSVIAVPSWRPGTLGDPSNGQGHTIGKVVENMTPEEASPKPTITESEPAQSIFSHQERLQVRWSTERGWIDLYDPLQRQWHTIPAKGNPRWLYDLLPQRKA